MVVPWGVLLIGLGLLGWGLGRLALGSPAPLTSLTVSLGTARVVVGRLKRRGDLRFVCSGRGTPAGFLAGVGRGGVGALCRPNAISTSLLAAIFCSLSLS